MNASECFFIKVQYRNETAVWIELKTQIDKEKKILKEAKIKQSNVLVECSKANLGILNLQRKFISKQTSKRTKNQRNVQQKTKEI